MARRLLNKAQENADEFSNEVEQLRSAVARIDEEKQRLEVELGQIKEMLQREVTRADSESQRNSVIIAEYKKICQRLEDDYNTAKASLSDLRTKISKCENCSSSNKEEPTSAATTPTSTVLSNAPDIRVDPILSRAQERVRELELELAQTKLAHVEAECRNQDLTHQLHAAAVELQTARNTWPPWLSKTLSSIKEAANKRQDVIGGGASILRRDSAPAGAEVRHSAIQHSNRDSLKEAV